MDEKPSYEELEQWVHVLQKADSEHKQAENFLQKSQALFTMAFNSSPSIMIISRIEDGCLLKINEAFLRILGYEREEVLGKTSIELGLYSDENDRASFVDMLKRDGRVADIELCVRAKSGEEKIVLIGAEAIEVDGEECMLSSGEDITQRKLAEIALRTSENEYKSTLNDLSIGVVVHNKDTAIMFSNPEATNILGLTFEQMSGKKTIDPAWHFLHEDFSVMDVEDYPVSKVSATKNPLNDYVVGIKRPDRDYITWVIASAIPILSAGNELEKIIVNFVDITSFKKSEKEKAKLESQLRQAAKIETVGTLAGGIAHDFNNILGIIIGNTELAMDDIPLWNPARNNLDEIKIASLRARDVVRQLLSFSRTSEQEKRPIKIHSIVKESVQLLRASIPATIEFRIKTPTEPVAIMADTTQIHQIIINICTNAAHAMEEKGGILEITLGGLELDKKTSENYLQLPPGTYLQLTISDTGCGIDPKIEGRIFDPYFTTKDIGKGSGLGLSLVHGIVKNHDGVIFVDSELNKGTTVKILFPAIHQNPEPKFIDSTELPMGNETVLLIDDEEAIASMGQQILGRLGYQVEVKTSPKDALDQFRINPNQFDLIITDMTMPHMTGDKLAEEILAIRPDMPIIICTGFSEKISKESVGDLGIRRYMEKPLNKRQLSVVIREVLDEKR